MKIYTKIILDKNNQVLKEEFFEYSGPMALAGIHYTYGANKNAKLMEKQAKRERKLAERKAKREAKMGKSDQTQDKSIPITETITLAHLTDPDNNKK